MSILFSSLPTETARHYPSGGGDATGQRPEFQASDGDGTPCRHGLQMIPQGAGMPILAHRPFPSPQPYAEVGPIFLCADRCMPGGGAALPAILASPDYILRGSSAADRIVYGTGSVIPISDSPARAEDLLRNPEVAYVHVRSTRNNCCQVRTDRA